MAFETDRHRRPRHRREQRHRRRHRPPARRARRLRRARGPPQGPPRQPSPPRSSKAGGTALVVEADITDRAQAEAAVQQTVEHFGRLDILVNNAGLMLLGPVVGADAEEWERMIAINVQGLLYTTHAALPHLLKAAEDGPRRVADIVNISSIAGRVAWNGYGVYNLTKFGVNGFTESLRQEVTQRHVRVGVLEPGGVATELGSHNNARGPRRDDRPLLRADRGPRPRGHRRRRRLHGHPPPPRLHRRAVDHAHRPGLTIPCRPLGVAVPGFPR